MTSCVRHPLTVLWLFLSVITIISWWSGSAHGAAAYEANLTITIAVLLMALIKTRLVIWHYMEVRSGPRWLRLTCDAWLLSLFGLIAFFYWRSL